LHLSELNSEDSRSYSRYSRVHRLSDSCLCRTAGKPT